MGGSARVRSSTATTDFTQEGLVGGSAGDVADGARLFPLCPRCFGPCSSRRVALRRRVFQQLNVNVPVGPRSPTSNIHCNIRSD